MDWMGIVDWLGKQGQLAGLYNYGGNNAGVYGQFDPDTKEIALWNQSQMQDPNRILSHELIHALQYSNLPNRFQTQMAMLNELSQDSRNKGLVEALAYPTHWLQGQMEDERVPQVIPPLQPALAQTRANRLAGTSRQVSRYAPEFQAQEQQAYALTDASGIDNPYRQLGMYLRNYGIPWDYVK
jgi:hypothetical protein